MYKYPSIQRIFTRYVNSGFGRLLIQRYEVTDFDVITLFGVADITYLSGGRSFFLFQLLLGADYEQDVESIIHVIRSFESAERANIAYNVLTKL